MREELDALIGVGWGECSRQQQRLSQWLLHSCFGHLFRADRRPEGVKTIVKANSTPRLLNGTVGMNLMWQKHSTGMFVAGTSTHKVGEVAQTLMGVAKSASTISRLNQTLIQQFEAWRERSLQEYWRIVYLDGVHFRIRHGGQI
jgi:hypothetical protein